MKNFGSLLLAAVLGSALTFAVVRYFDPAGSNIKIEHVAGVPARPAAFTLNERGEAVPLDFVGTADKVMNAVVHIKSTQERAAISRGDENNPFRDFFFTPPTERGPSVGTGSGVIINEGGYIVTNNHVVQGADIVEVTLHDNRSFKAEVVGVDTDTDIALLKVSEKGLPYLSFVNSDNTRVGEWVLAVGNPFNLNSTVTAGIISAKGRSINIIRSNNQAGKEGGQPLNTAIESFIQTDAAINPGNSGGALVDLNGGLIGINTAIASQTGSYVGYGFAVPSNIVSKVVEDLLAYGTVQRGWLGVTVQSVNSELAKEKDLNIVEGAYVATFADKSAAKEAGIEEGDVVVRIDNAEIKSSTALIEYIGRKRPGDKVSMTVNRKGKTVVIPVVLKNREGKLGTVKREEADAIASLGMELSDAEAGVLKKLDLKNGVKVKLNEGGKVARYTDMQDGFIITRVDDQPVKSAKEVNELLRKKKPGELTTFSGVYENYPREYIYAIRM
ncbi:MAG: Do family serine endopeptidase [Cyclobacteriaceae bacterium]|nr:Do family serine endopeptidase [Cyclobacteriaceae bacterium]